MENVTQMFFCTDGTLQYYRDSAIGIHTKASSNRSNILRKKDKVNISLLALGTLFNIILYHTILYYCVLYYTIFGFMLFHIILYYLVLYPLRLWRLGVGAGGVDGVGALRHHEGEDAVGSPYYNDIIYYYIILY